MRSDRGARDNRFPRVALDLLQSGHIDVLPLISKTLPLEAGLEAFEYVKRNPCLKALLAPAPPAGKNRETR